MKKKTTPILVFTGLAIAVAAGIAGLTREQWMGQPAPAVAPPEPATPPVSEAPSAPPAPATAETPAAAPGTPAAAESTAAPTAPAAQTAAVEAPEQATEPTPPAPAPAAGEEQMASVQPEPVTPPEMAPPPEPAEQPAAQPETAPAPNTATEAEMPAFDTVRIEKTGEAVIAGRAEAGSEVVIKLNGLPIGKTVANSDGAFVLVPEKPLPAGSGAITIEATGKGSLQPVISEQSVAVIVPDGQPQQALVAIVSPDAPTKVLQKPEPPPEEPAPAQPEAAAAQPAAEQPEAAAEQPAAEQTAAAQPAAEQPEAAAEQPAAQQPVVEQPTVEQKPAKLVSIDAVDYDSAGNIVFSGQGETGNTARLYVDNQFLGDALVGEDGRWSFAGTANIAQGVHTLRVDGLDAQGNVLNRVEVPFFREDQTKVAEATQPAAPEAEQPAMPAQPEAPAEQQPAAANEPAAPAEAPASTAAETPASGEETMQPSEETIAATAPAAPQVPREGRIVIQPGNNLWRISRVLYGAGSKFTMIYEANKEQIRNPDLIYPGQVFKTPKVAPKVETIDPKRRTPLTPEEDAATAE